VTVRPGPTTTTTTAAAAADGAEVDHQALPPVRDGQWASRWSGRRLHRGRRRARTSARPPQADGSCHPTVRPLELGGPVTGTVVVTLAGNPNTGKSTLFNALTGGRQHVGNWPGKTVACAEGSVEVDGVTVRFVDLPGAYSLRAACRQPPRYRAIRGGGEDRGTGHRPAARTRVSPTPTVPPSDGSFQRSAADGRRPEPAGALGGGAAGTSAKPIARPTPAAELDDRPRLRPPSPTVSSSLSSSTAKAGQSRSPPPCAGWPIGIPEASPRGDPPTAPCPPPRPIPPERSPSRPAAAARRAGHPPERQSRPRTGGNCSTGGGSYAVLRNVRFAICGSLRFAYPNLAAPRTLRGRAERPVGRHRGPSRALCPREPTGAANEPTGAANEPTGAANEPTGAGNEPTGAGNEPTGAGKGDRSTRECCSSS